MSRWIKLDESILDWEWFGNGNMVRVFVYCIFKAQWKDSKWKGKTIKRGQFVTSYRKMADKLDLSPNTIRTIFSKLSETGELKINSTANYTVVTVVNYDKYQSTVSKNDTVIDTVTAQ